MASLETIRRLTVQASISGNERVESALAAIARAGGDVTRASEGMVRSSDGAVTAIEKTGKAAENARRGYENFQRTFNPLQKDIDMLSRGFGQLERAWGQKIGIETAARDIDLLISKTRQAQAEERKLLEIQNERAAQAASASQFQINQQYGIGARPATELGATFSALAEEMHRLEAEEKHYEEIQRLRGEAIGQAFQQGLNDSFGIGGRSASQMGATFSALEEEMKRLDQIEAAYADHVRAVSQANIALLTGQNRPSAASQGATHSALEEEARRQDALAASAAELKQRIDPLGEATKRYTMELERNKEMLKLGLLTTYEFAKANDYAAQKLTLVQKGASYATSGLTNLSFQINDVVSGLVMGQSVFTIAAQQGGQIYQALNGPQGVSAGAKAAVSGLLSLITPARAAGVALVAAAIESTMAWNRFSDQQREIRTTLGGLGRGLGVTPEQFNATTSGLAGAIGLSEREASKLGIALARTGNIGIENLARLGGLSKDLAGTLGIDAEKAAELLGSLGNIGGVQALNNQLRFLNATTLATVANLFAVGQKQEGIALVATKMKDALVPYKDTVSGTQLIWERISNTISDIDRKYGQWLAKQREQAALARQQLVTESAAAANVRQNPEPGQAGTMNAGRTSRMSGPLLPTPPNRPYDIQTEEQRDSRFEAAQQRAAERMAFMRQVNEQSEVLRQRVMEAGVPVGELEKMQTQLKALQELQKPENAMLRDAAMTRQDFNEGLSITTHLLENLKRPTGERITDEERTQQIMQKTLELNDTWDTSTRNRIEQEIKALQLGKERITVEDAKNQVDNVAKTNDQQRMITRREDITQRERELALMDRYGPEAVVQQQLLQKELEYRRNRMTLSAAELQAEELLIRKTQERSQVQAQLEKLYSDFIKPGEDYVKVIEAANAMLAKGAINATQYATAITDAKIKMEEAKGTMEGGLSAGLLKVGRDFGDVSKQMESFVTGAGNSITTGLADMLDGTKSLKQGFSDLSKTIVRSLEEMMIKMLIVAPIAKQLQSAISGGGGLGGLLGLGNAGAGVLGASNTAAAAASSSVSNAATAAALLHKGGIVGIDGQTRYVHPAYFDDAPRHHGGYGPQLGADERAAILRNDEGVFTASQMRALGRGQATPAPEFHFHNAPPIISQEETRNPNGGLRVDTVFGQAVAGSMQHPQVQRAMAGYGVKPALKRR